MAKRSYNVEWRYRAAREVLTNNSVITISERDEANSTCTVLMTNTELGDVTTVADVDTNGNIIFTLDNGATRTVMSEWQDMKSQGQPWSLYGEVFKGDPEGTGGFGGQDDGTGTEPES